jgi:hypothetical protein
MENTMQTNEQGKKEYRSPNLVVHGEVRVLTQALSTGIGEEGNQGATKGKPATPF